MSDAYYEVTINLGPFEWVLEHPSMTPPDPDDDHPLGGLEIGWTVPESDLMPVQPDPMDAAFSVLVNDIDTYTDLDVGSEVAVRVRLDPAGPVVFSFFGRLTDLTSTPAQSGRSYLNVIALDYTADERPVGLVDWPVETVQDRLNRIWAECAALPGDAEAVLPAMTLDDPTDYVLDARSAAPTTLPAEVRDYLAWFIGENPAGGYGRYILSPRIQGTSLHPFNYCFDALTGMLEVAPFGEFGPTDGGDYGITLDGDPADLVFEGYVDQGVTWSKRKYGAVNAIVMTVADGTVIGADALVRGTGASPMVTATVATQLAVTFSGTTDTADHALEGLVGYYLNGDATSRWEVDGFTYRLSRHIDAAGVDPADLPAGWLFPNHAADPGDPERTNCYLMPIAFEGIVETQNPGSGGFYAGRLRGARLTITRGEMTVALAVRRTLPDVDPALTLTPGGLAASAYAAVTVAQLDPDFSVYDYRLAQEA